MNFIGNAVDELKALKDKVKDQAQEFANEKHQMLKDFEVEKKRLISGQIFGKLNNLFEATMVNVLAMVKDAADDPYMPNTVRQALFAIIDATWPDVKNELKDSLLQEINEPPMLHHSTKLGCWFAPAAYFRYSLMPYDRNIWRQLRDPFWIFFTLLSIVPKWNVAIVMYTILFFFIDKRDEFQLQYFIIKFKSLQYVSLGIASTLVGAAQYFICTSNDPANCDEYSPREDMFTLGLFVWQVILVWMSFILLPYSKRKGGQFYQLDKTQEETLEDGVLTWKEALLTENFQEASAATDEGAAQRSRRRFRWFLFYDLMIFLICVVLVLLMAFYFALDTDVNVLDHEGGVTAKNWKFVTGLYWIKAFYGLMSFPFCILLIPGVSSAISHARPTGYNPYGNTVPMKGVEENRPVPWDPMRRPKPVHHRRREPDEPGGEEAREPIV